jgi:predicted RNase H-like nuclease (RuvC/YqgF family)
MTDPVHGARQIEKLKKRIQELEQQLEEVKRENKEYSHIVARDVTTIFHLEQEVGRLRSALEKWFAYGTSGNLDSKMFDEAMDATEQALSEQP